MRKVLLALAVSTVSCSLFGDEDADKQITWTALTGAPNAVFSLSFDPKGAPVAVGGFTTFGPMHVQRFRGDLWVRAEGLPEAEFGDVVLRARDELFAVVTKRLYRLTDADAFRFTELPLPAKFGDSSIVKIVGVARDGTAFATARFMTEGTIAIVKATPGAGEWTAVNSPDNAPNEDSAIVEPSGRVTWIGRDGVYRHDGTSVAKAIDCKTPELFYCDAGLTHPTYDASGNLFFLICPQIREPRSVYRVDNGSTTPRKLADIPRELTYCLNLQAVDDGTVFLTVATDNSVTKEVGLFRLRNGDAPLQQIAAPTMSNHRYIARDGGTVYRVGDGKFASGVEQGTF